MQTEAKQKAMQDLQDYTHNLEAMYNVGISICRKPDTRLSVTSASTNPIIPIQTFWAAVSRQKTSPYIQMTYFETKIFPTKALIDQGDYKLNQLGNIDVLEIKSLLSAKMIYADVRSL